MWVHLSSKCSSKNLDQIADEASRWMSRNGRRRWHPWSMDQIVRTWLR